MDNNRGSRLDKFEQKRKFTKLITWLVIVAGVLLVFLIGIFVFSDSEASKQREQAMKADEEQTVEPKKTDTDSENIKKKADAEKEKAKAAEKKKKEQLEKEEKEKKKKEKDNDKLKKKKVNPSDDNVKEAYTANWKPIGTEQTGGHTTNYDEGSQDRSEMEQAIREATGLSSMTTWWLGRDGEQQVVATVSNKANESEVYRVQLKWIDEKGWQPQKVEELKQNDQKYRYR